MCAVQTRSLYEAGGEYKMFAGRECGRALSKMWAVRYKLIFALQ